MTATPTRLHRIGSRELLVLLSLTMALTALSIDLMLPAFGEIRAAFDMPPDSSATAAIVTVFFIGLAVAQMFYGPFADRFGRKPVLYVGLSLYALGALGAALAPSFGLLLASRFLWGVGAAGARVISLAIVRDTYAGDRMARAMSLLNAVFILVPVLAPSVGAAIISVAPWRAVFWFCVAYVGGVALWTIRLPETFDPANRIDLHFAGLKRAALLVITQRQAMRYTAAVMVLFGVFASYLASSELIVDDVFDMGSRFPLVFGGLAALMGMAALANASIVGRFGARRIVTVVLMGYVAGAVVLVAISAAGHGTPPFWGYAPALALMLCMHSLLIPNLYTLAMEPMGVVAGTASALIGTAQTGGGALLGSFVDRAYNGTVTPLSIGFLVSGILALLVVRGSAPGGSGVSSRT
jgi:DHA1 family bicyclomycin/chloramphenicol resistance-like MFS transporter